MKYRTITTGQNRIVDDAELAAEEKKRRDPVRYVVGVDLGKVNDYTAIAVGTYIAEDRHALDLVYLERLKLGTPYPEQVARIDDIVRRPPIAGRSTLVLDATGVGGAVVDMVKETGLRPLAVTITGGMKATETDDDCWSVPKADLVAAVQVALQANSLRVAEGLPEAETLRDELASYQQKVTDAANLTFDGVGAHDDTVIAAALCAWWVSVQPSRCEVW